MHFGRNCGFTMYINNKYIQFDGWIKKQLICQSNSLFGNLDKIWKDIKDSKWLGGKEEGWERFPYYLNGLISLAYALNDEELIKIDLFFFPFWMPFIAFLVPNYPGWNL